MPDKLIELLISLPDVRAWLIAHGWTAPLGTNISPPPTPPPK